MVTHTPMKSARTYVIQRYTERHVMLIVNLSDFLHNCRLGLTPVCSLSLDFQRDNTVCSWLYDESS